MATEYGEVSDGSKKRRTDEEQAAEEEDRISALPEALRLHILGLLPLKSAIRTGALSTQWRALWTRRWPASASLDLRLGPHDSPQPLLESLERRGRRRLDRFSLYFQIGQLKPEDLGRCLDYAVADLDVHLLDLNQAYDRCFNFCALPGNRHLARLSLNGICVHLTDCLWYQSQLHYALPRPYSALEVIHLHRVTIENATLYHLVAACPRLRTIDIRYCDEDLRCASLAKARAKAKSYLQSVTIVECESLADVRISNWSSLRSFRYSGAYLAAGALPTRSAIEGLYICFGGPACRRLRSRHVKYDDYGRPRKLRGCWLDRLIKLSNLTVLTLCSSALRRVSAKARARSTAGNAASCKLQNLREVQLLMFAMYNDSLDDIMAFLMTCCSPRLERLFVQLPTRSNQYKPDEEPSESEEDGSEVESSSEDLSKGEESEWSEEDQPEQDESEEEGSEEDQSEQDESDEEGLDENHSKDCESEEQGFTEGETKQDESEEEESEEDHSQEDESEEDYLQDDESEEDHSQDDESEEDHSQDKSEEEGSEEDHSKEDESDENGLAEGQSKDGSGGGQSAEELLGDGCGNLMLLKMMNFMGHHNEMRLVSFVLKKSGCLKQLILFTPESDHPEGPKKDHLNTSEFIQTKLLPLEKASPCAQIILSEPDAAAIKPLHSETFVNV